jgi:hypothetical protein
MTRGFASWPPRRVLNRGVGKPRDHADDERNGGRINLSRMSSKELTSLATLLRKALGLDPHEEDALEV